MKNFISRTKGGMPFICGVGLLWCLCVIYASSYFEILELFGIFVFTFNSVKYAYDHMDKHKHNKYFYYAIAAFVCTFGGGIFRDLFLLNRTPALLLNVVWIIIAFCGINFSVVYNKYRFKMQDLLTLFEVIDYTAIIVFIQGGYVLAREYGLNEIMALLSGIVTGCCGGIFVTLLFYRNIKAKVLGTFDSIGNTFIGLAVLYAFDFKQDTRVLITWFLISAYKVEKNYFKRAVINLLTLNVIPNYRNIQLIKDFYKPRLFAFSYEKYFMDLYLEFILRVKRIKSVKKLYNSKYKNCTRKKYFYFRSAVKTFA